MSFKHRGYVVIHIKKSLTWMPRTLPGSISNSCGGTHCSAGALEAQLDSQGWGMTGELLLDLNWCLNPHLIHTHTAEWRFQRSKDQWKGKGRKLWKSGTFTALRQRRMREMEHQCFLSLLLHTWPTACTLWYHC